MRFLLLRGEDLDLIAVLQYIINRYELVVHFCAYASGTDLGVDLKCKVKRSSTVRQSFQFPLWCENKYFVTEKITPEIIDKVQGGVIVLLQQIPDAGKPLLQI